MTAPTEAPRHSIALIVRSKELDHGWISAKLGLGPTAAGDAGDRKSFMTRSAAVWVHKWACSPGDSLSVSIAALLDAIAPEAACREVANRYGLVLSCGLYVADGQGGLAISADMVAMCASRGISIDVEVYAV